jgi:hypothetical protein
VTRKLLRVVVLLLPVALAGTEPADQNAKKKASRGPAPKQVTVNPEARISVMQAGLLPTPASCGTSVELAVHVVNQGFVTAPLDAQIVADKPAGVELVSIPNP